MYSVVLFYSNNHAVWCNDCLSENNLDNKMISVPRELSSDCGYCIRFNRNDTAKVKSLLDSNGIEFDRIENI